MSDRPDKGDRFVWNTGDVELSHCLYCTRWRQGACEAFPNGIPFAILSNRADHRQPYPNDGGVRFEPRSDEAAEIVEAIFDRKRQRVDRGIRRSSGTTTTDGG